MRELAEIVRLRRGHHRRPGDGVCTMELVAWMAGEKHSDRPRSASPVLAEFTRSFNDALDATQRQRLGTLAARMVGSRGTPDQERVRGQILWNWMISAALPTWLGAARRQDLAAEVVSGRGGALRGAITAIGAHDHVTVRPAGDHRTSADVRRALAESGVTGACLAGGEIADELTGSRARRRWNDAHVLARAAAWNVAEPARDGRWHAGGDCLRRTADAVRESAFVLADRLVRVTEPPVMEAPAAPWPADPSELTAV
jgi:hypothetical protein